MNVLKSLGLVCATALLLACASVDLSPQGKDGGAPTEPSARQLAGDMPLPPGASIRAPDTLVMGSGNRWIGRISLSVPGESQSIFAYFRDGLPGAGWTLTSSSYSKLSLLTFSKGERVASVQLQPSSFGGNEVLITVTPAVRPAGTAP
jgi:hypothetical protein